MTAWDEALGDALGLEAPKPGPPCHGYQCCCVCPSCAWRRGMVSPDFEAWLERSDDAEPVPAPYLERPAPRQPWEPKRGN